METVMNAPKFRLSAIREKVAAANAKKADVAGKEIAFDFTKLDNEVKGEWEMSARATLIRMFQEADFEVNFTFKVAPGTADHYVNAMRSVMARVRAKAARRKQAVEHFKMLVVEVKHQPTHDAVTLVRTKNSSAKTKSAYDELLGFVAAESEDK